MHRVIVQFFDFKVSAMVAAVLGLPSTIATIALGETVPLSIGIATGVLGFLWACRRYPIDQFIKDAREASKEVTRLRKQNADLAVENEQLRVRNAHLEETGKPPLPKIADSP